MQKQRKSKNLGKFLNSQIVDFLEDENTFVAVKWSKKAARQVHNKVLFVYSAYWFTVGKREKDIEHPRCYATDFDTVLSDNNVSFAVQ